MPFTDSISMVDVIITTKTQLTATPSDVVAGKQFIGTTQHIESGTLPMNPTRTDVTLVAGESYNIPNGVNPVSYNVIAKALGPETPGDAGPADILVNKTAWVNGEKITGNMPNIGKEEETLICGASHQISRGFHDGTGVIKAKSLFDQTKASVVAGDLLTGSTCWANGEFISGTMVNNGKVEASLNAGESYSIPVGYHDGTGSITANSLASQTVANADAEKIVQGYTAWVNGSKVTGSMASNAAEQIVLPLNGSYTIPNGYHTGLGTISQNIPTKQAQTIGPTKEAQTIALAGYYMEGDITITGVDAMNYQRTGAVVKDAAGTDISNYALSVTDNTATVKIYTDNWHDNATLNVYSLRFVNLVDKDGNAVNLSCTVLFDYNPSIVTFENFGNISISCSIDYETNSQMITISGITSGNLTMYEAYSAREFGVS